MTRQDGFTQSVGVSTRKWIFGLIVFTVLLSITGSIGFGAKTKLTIGTFAAPETWKNDYGAQMENFLNNNPDIELELLNLPHSDFAAKVLVLAATGDLPDVLQIPPEQAAPIVVSGALENIEPWIARDSALNTKAWIPAVTEAVKYNGIMFGVPGYVVNYTYAYNKDILAERGIVPPAADEWITWGKMRDIGKRAGLDKNGDGVSEIWGFFHGYSYTEILPLLFQNGSFIFDKNQLLNINTPAMYEGVNWLLGLIKEGIHGGSRAGFYNGSVATMRLGSWEMNNIINNKVPIGVSSGIQNKTKGEVMYVTSFAMTSGSKNKDAAWRYLKYLTSKESQEYVVLRGRVPMRRDVSMPDTTKVVLTGLINSLSAAQSYPYHINSDYIQRAFNSGMAKVWNLQVTPEAVIPEVERTINAYLQNN